MSRQSRTRSKCPTSWRSKVCKPISAAAKSPEDDQGGLGCPPQGNSALGASGRLPGLRSAIGLHTSSGELLAKMLPDVQTFACCRAGVAIPGVLLVAEGNYDEAVRTALVLFRLARHFDRNPMLVGYLVAIAIRGMAVDSANWCCRPVLSRKESAKHWMPNLPSRSAWKDTDGQSRATGPSTGLLCIGVFPFAILAYWPRGVESAGV